jgi:hypothetical protein
MLLNDEFFSALPDSRPVCWMIIVRRIVGEGPDGSYRNGLQLHTFIYYVKNTYQTFVRLTKDFLTRSWDKANPRGAERNFSEIQRNNALFEHMPQIPCQNPGWNRTRRGLSARQAQDTTTAAAVLSQPPSGKEKWSARGNRNA